MFFVVEKMDNFHFDLVKFVGSHGCLLNLRMNVENFVFVKIGVFAGWYEKFELFAVYLHSYNYVLQMFFVFVMVSSLVYMFDNPYVNNLE